MKLQAIVMKTVKKSKHICLGHYDSNRAFMSSRKKLAEQVEA